MGKTLKRVFGGLATGAGNYLVAKATEDAKTAREERIAQREMAMKALDLKAQSDRIDQQGAWQVTGIRETAAQTRLNYGAQGTVTKDVDNNRGAIERHNAAEETKNKALLLKVQGEISRSEAIALRKFDANEANKKDPVKTYERNAEGYWIGLTEKGNVVNTGQKAPPEAVKGEGGDSTDPFRPTGTGTKGSGAPAPVASGGGSVGVGTIINGPNGPMKMGPDGKWQKL